MDYVRLNGITLEEDPDGVLYRRKVFDGGSYILEAVADEYTETVRVDASTVADITFRFDTDSGEYVEVSRTERQEAEPEPEKSELEIRLESIETDSINTMLAVTEAYETADRQNTSREQETTESMLALTEVFELALQLQTQNAELLDRIKALEAAKEGGAS